jgi:hypothetical protein
VSQHHIKVVGPRDSRASYEDLTTIFTVSRAEDWQRELSPFHLGPIPLYDGTSARCLEGAWQFAKCYAQHLSPDGAVLPAYWSWARRGWSSHAIRYPMGKGAKPEFCLWDGQRLGYVDARKRVYWRLYRDAVRETGAWRRLVELHGRGPMALWDFDGFDHDSQRMPLSEVIEQTKRPMGHAFVLKAMPWHTSSPRQSWWRPLNLPSSDSSTCLPSQLRRPVPHASIDHDRFHTANLDVRRGKSGLTARCLSSPRG